MKTKIKMSTICDVIIVFFIVAWLTIHKNHSGFGSLVYPWLLASRQFQKDVYIQNSKGDKIFLFILSLITLLLSSALLFMVDDDSLLYTIQIVVGGIWLFLNGRTDIRNGKTGIGLILTFISCLAILAAIWVAFFL